jgi:hypothetical protein
MYGPHVLASGHIIIDSRALRLCGRRQPTLLVIRMVGTQAKGPTFLEPVVVVIGCQKNLTDSSNYSHFLPVHFRIVELKDEFETDIPF